MKVKGTRNPNALHIEQQANNIDATTPDDYYVVAHIDRQRLYRGKVQYLVAWEGYDKMTWVNAEDMNCPELMEDWEIQQSNM